MATAKTDAGDRLDNLLISLAGAALGGDATSARQIVSRIMRPGRGQRTLSPEIVQRLGRLTAEYDREGPVQLEAHRTARARSTRVDAGSPPVLLKLSTLHGPDPVLPESVMTALNQIVQEQARARDLQRHALWPTRRLLLVGKPGVGKTMSAAHVARQLGVPLATIDPTVVMSSLLGESARNLRQALDWGRTHKCVVFIDEFDAFAKSRDDATDVGELKRLVNMLLLELDRWDAEQLLVAATNHPQLLDSAVQRRFDVRLEIPPPDYASREQIAAALLAHHDVEVDSRIARVLAALSEGATGSDLTTLVTGAIRRAILNERGVDAEMLESLTPPLERTRTATRARAVYCALAHDLGGLSNRELAQQLGLSNSSVSGLVRSGRRALANGTGEAAQ